MVTSVGALGKHQAVTDHRGRTRVDEQYRREVSRRGGTRSGALRAERCAADPAYRETFVQGGAAGYSPERRQANRERMKSMLAVRYRCECGFESNAGGVALHHKATGHRGRVRTGGAKPAA
jgi:hypothetical protein